MPRRRVVPHRAGQGLGQGAGAVGRHDAVAVRDGHEGRALPARRIDGLARHAPLQAGGRVLPVPAAQAFPRHRGRQGDAVVQPVLQRHEMRRPRGARLQPGEGTELARHAERIELGEEGLDHLDRQGARGGEHRLQQRQQAGEAARAGRLIPRMEVPGRGEQGEGAHPVRPPHRRCQGQQPAHAIARQHHRPGRRRQGAFQPPGDEAGQVHPPLHIAGIAPVQQQGARALFRQPGQDRMPGHQVQHPGPVHQGGHEEQSGAGGPGRPMVQQPAGAFLPEDGMPRAVRRRRLPAIGREAADQPRVEVEEAPRHRGPQLIGA